MEGDETINEQSTKLFHGFMAARVSVMSFFLFPWGNVNFIRTVNDLAISLPILNSDSNTLRHV